jgi:hypothetical protein
MDKTLLIFIVPPCFSPGRNPGRDARQGLKKLICLLERLMTSAVRNGTAEHFRV